MTVTTMVTGDILMIHIGHITTHGYGIGRGTPVIGGSAGVMTPIGASTGVGAITPDGTTTRSIGDGVITITIGIITIIIGTMGITITMPTAGVMTGQRTKGAESTRATVCSAEEAAEPPIPRQHAVKTVRHQPPQYHRAAAPQRQLLREAQHPRPAHGARLLSRQRGLRQQTERLQPPQQ